MEILVCVKRVPTTGSKIVLTDDEQDINTKNLGFTISPHEECGVEEAVRMKKTHKATVTVMALGPKEATEQLRFCLALGADRAVLLEANGAEWNAMSTANAITEAIKADQAAGRNYDLILFGNESADAGNYQVGIRVAHALGIPCVNGIKHLEVENGQATVRREVPGGWEVYQVPTPAALGVLEGINLPRYPSVPGRLKAKKKKIEEVAPQSVEGGMQKVRLKNPVETHTGAEILGNSTEAAIEVVKVLQKIGVV